MSYRFTNSRCFITQVWERSPIKLLLKSEFYWACGAGGNRTLVQTKYAMTFYMLILWLVFVEKLDTNTRISRLASIVSYLLRGITNTNPFWMMSQFLGRKGHRLGETTRPSYYYSEWIKLEANLRLSCESVWRVVIHCSCHEINELQHNARHADTMRSHLLSNPGRPRKISMQRYG